MDIDKYLERFTPRERRMIFILIVLALVFVLYEFFFFFFIPRLQKTEAEITNMGNELNLARQRIENSSLIKKELEQKMMKNEELKSFLAGDLSEGTLYSKLGVAARQNGVQITTLTPGTVKEGDLYLEMPLSLKLEGDYFSLKKMLKEIDDFRPLLVINSFEIAKPKEGLLSASLNLTAYGSKEENPPIITSLPEARNINPFLGENEIALSLVPQIPEPKKESSSSSSSETSPPSAAPFIPATENEEKNKEEREEREEKEFLFDNPYAFPLLLTPFSDQNFKFPFN